MQLRMNTAATAKLQEIVAEAHAPLPGEVNVIVELPQANVYAPLLRCGLCDEGQLQLLAPPPRFLVMSTAGTVELTRNRPLELLQALLLRRSSTHVREFFADLGAAAACSLCFMLATPSGMTHAVPSDVVILAEQCLSDMNLVGRAEWREEAPQGFAVSGYGTVTNESEPEWSSMRNGLCIMLYRMLHPVRPYP